MGCEEAHHRRRQVFHTGHERFLEASGVETIAADLLDPEALAALPDAGNVIFVTGRKFGSTGKKLTWAMNVFLPGAQADRAATNPGR